MIIFIIVWVTLRLFTLASVPATHSSPTQTLPQFLRKNSQYARASACRGRNDGGEGRLRQRRFLFSLFLILLLLFLLLLLLFLVLLLLFLLKTHLH